MPTPSSPSQKPAFGAEQIMAQLQDMDPIDIMEKMLATMRAYIRVPQDELVVPARDSNTMDKLRGGRIYLLKCLLNADLKTVRLILNHTVVLRAVFSGLLHQPLDPAERSFVEQARANFLQGWKAPHVYNFFAIVQLYYQAFELPLMLDGLEQIEKDIAASYLNFCIRSPVCIYKGDDRKHADHLIKFMNWCAERVLNPVYQAWSIPTLVPIIQCLSVDAIFHAEFDVHEVIQARVRLINTLNKLLATKSNQVITPYARTLLPAGGRKIRIGYLSRTIQQGADTQVILAEIGHFDPDKIEVYIYSRDIQDLVYKHDVGFYRQFFAHVNEVRSIEGLSTERFIDLIRKDGLDIFIAHDSNFGFGFYDFALAHRVAPIQVILSRIVPLSTWYDSFDYYLIPKVRDDLMPVLAEQSSEILRRIPGALLAYDRSHEQAKDHVITRKMLNIKDDEIMLLCGSASLKIVPSVCETFARILAQLPNAKLALATLHPAHGGESTLPLLESRLAVALKNHGISRDRIIMLNRMQPQDCAQLLDLADVYLCQWPLGGATWIMMSLAAAIPIVVKDSDLMHGIGNQSLIRGAGFDDLVVADEDEYVKLVVALATDKEKNQSVRQRLKAARDTMPHNDLKTFSQQMQDCYIGLVDEVAAHQARSRDSSPPN